MKKTMILALAFALAFTASLALFAGCGGGEAEQGLKGEGESSGETTELTDDSGRKITVEEPAGEGESGKVTLEGEGGQQSTIEVQEQAPSEEALGAPIYPGSQYVEGSGVSGTTASGDKQLTASGAEFTTTDAVTKVVDWYKGKLGAPMASAADTTTWMQQDQTGAIVTVIVEPFEGKVKITIAKVSGDIDIRL